MTPKFPESWTRSQGAKLFLQRLANVSGALLMLDYDGTLAPFTENRTEASLYPGVRERLERLVCLEGSRTVLVSGRQAHQLQGMLPLTKPIEIWGSHGREHLATDGSYEYEPLTAYEERVLDQIRDELEKEYSSEILECKPNSIAVHWRGRALRRSEIEARMHQLYRGVLRSQEEGQLELLPFDGGIELRAGQVDKGHAVRRMLKTLASGEVAAFLGDDTTDERAFQALDTSSLEDLALGVLVRVEPRPSFARVWLKPPEELLQFLDAWIEAASAKHSKQQVGAEGRS